MANQFDPVTPKADSRVLLLAALGTAALLRWYLAAHVDCINSDGVQYISIARHFYAGEWARGLANYFPPGYPLVIAAAHLLIDDWERAGTAVSFAAGMLTFAPLIGLARLVPLTAREQAVLVLGFALCPYPARYAAQVRSEALYGLLLVTAMWLAARYLTGGRRRLVGFAGALIGLAYLTRPEGLGLLIPFGAALFWSRQSTRRRSGVLPAFAAMTATALLVAAPYLLYLRADTGRWLASRKMGMVVTTGLKETTGEGTLVGMEESADYSLGELIASHPRAFVEKVVVDTGRTLVAFAECLYYAYVPFLILGVILSRSLYVPQVNRILQWVVWFNVFVLALLYVNRRYYTALVGPALIWAATGFVWLSQRLRQWRPRAAIALAVITLAAILAKALRIPGEDQYPRRFGEAIARAADAKPLVVAPVVQVAFYAGGEKVRATLPVDVAQLETWMAQGVSWLVVRDGDVAPAAQAFLDAGAGVTLIAETEEKKRPRLYRLQRRAAVSDSPAAGSP